MFIDPEIIHLYYFTPAYLRKRIVNIINAFVVIKNYLIPQDIFISFRYVKGNVGVTLKCENASIASIYEKSAKCE